MSKLIGISGKMLSGKDWTASLIQTLNPSFENRKFSFWLKMAVSVMFGVTVDQLEDQEFKERKIGLD